MITPWSNYNPQTLVSSGPRFDVTSADVSHIPVIKLKGSSFL